MRWHPPDQSGTLSSSGNRWSNGLVFFDLSLVAELLTCL